MGKIRVLKEGRKQDALKIRRLQKQCGFKLDAGPVPASDEMIAALREQVHAGERDRVVLAQKLLKAKIALTKISDMSRAKEAREAAGAALVVIR